MVELSAALAHAHASLVTAEEVRALFSRAPESTEKVAAHALFCRCLDHYRGALMLAQQGLDAEALALVRGIIETNFVISALLKGTLTTKQLEAFDRAGKAKTAKAQAAFLRRMAPAEVQDQVREFAERNSGPTIKFEALAKQIDAEDLYNGHYRMFSHVAAHPSLAAVEKYLDYGEDGTTVVYPGKGRSAQSTILIAGNVLMNVCASVEHWLGTTPEINKAINDRLCEHEAFGPMAQW